MIDPILRSAIAAVIPRPILKALHSPSGRGDFSTAAFHKLEAAGLCYNTFEWTEKGKALRTALGITE